MNTESERFVVYLRTSTADQVTGIEAQRAAVQKYVDRVGGRMVQPEFVEHESGKKNDRPQLLAAIELARRKKAILLVAKLDRLARNQYFIGMLQESDVKFRACDMPQASEMVLGIMAAVAQGEAKMISDRTKAALGALKAKGVQLGRPGIAGNPKGCKAQKEAADRFASRLLPDVARWRGEDGMSLAAIAERLNTMGVATARGGRWYPKTVSNLLARG